MRILFISNGLVPPYDEGGKIFARELSRHIHSNRLGDSVSNQYEDEGLGIVKIAFPKFVVCKQLMKLMRENSYDRILFLPHSPLTFWAFAKAFLIRIMTGTPVSLIGLQPWSYNFLQRMFIKRLSGITVWVQSKRTQRDLDALGVKAAYIPAGVDGDKFCPVTLEEKTRLRSIYRIPMEKKVVLHVGHMRVSRNLEWLARFADAGYYSLMLASTYRNSAMGAQESELEQHLYAHGVDIRSEFNPNVQELYQLADLYVFPVEDSLGAIEMPLSVFEALSCKLPVISTRFGGLDPSLEGQGLFFVDSSQAALEKALQIFSPQGGGISFPELAWRDAFEVLIAGYSPER